MRIVQAGHFQLRKYGKAKVSTELKLYNGFVRLNHNVQIFSERDTAAFEAPFGWRDLGRAKANRRLIETCVNFQPELLLLGHCDIIRNETLDEIRRLLPEICIAYRNVDALYVPANVARIKARTPHVDHVFLTTAGEEARAVVGDPGKVSYIPNPVDPAIECFDNSQKEADAFERDLVFCGRGDPNLPRFDIIRSLKSGLGEQLKFETFGFDGEPAVWGADYDHVLATSKMGLNLNRQEGAYLSSSARVAQLMGNGLLTFIHESTGMQKFFEGKAVFFASTEDLSEKLLEFQNDDEARRSVAAAGHRYVHEAMSSSMVAKFIVGKSMGSNTHGPVCWNSV